MCKESSTPSLLSSTMIDLHSLVSAMFLTQLDMVQPHKCAKVASALAYTFSICYITWEFNVDMIKEHASDLVHKSIMWNLRREGHLSGKTYYHLCSSAGGFPRLYGLPKFHKLDVPLRPIVSFVSLPTYVYFQIPCLRAMTHCWPH